MRKERALQIKNALNGIFQSDDDIPKHYRMNELKAVMVERIQYWVVEIDEQPQHRDALPVGPKWDGHRDYGDGGPKGKE